MNEIIKKILLAAYKFMPEMHLKQLTVLDKPGFTYRICGPFTKNKDRTQRFKETGDLGYVYQNKLD